MKNFTSDVLTYFLLSAKGLQYTLGKFGVYFRHTLIFYCVFFIYVIITPISLSHVNISKLLDIRKGDNLQCKCLRIFINVHIFE